MYKSINNETNKANEMYEKIMKEYDDLSKGALLFEKTRLEVEIECRNNWISPILAFTSLGISVLALCVSLVSCLNNNAVLISPQTVSAICLFLALIIIAIVIYFLLNRTDTRYELAVRLSYINELLEKDANQKKR